MSDGTPKHYKTRVIEPGIVSYENEGLGKVLVRKEALDRMAASFVGKPVVNLVHKDISEAEAFLSSTPDWKKGDGIVTKIWWEDDGWYWVEFLAWDPDTKAYIDEHDYGVSCSYKPTEDDDDGGMYHNIEYDGEILDGFYRHLAIVENPRYEGVGKPQPIGAAVYNNSLEDSMKKWKLFGKTLKNAMPDDSEKEKDPPMDNEKEGEMDMKMAYAMGEDGEKVPMEELVNAYMTQKEMEAQNADRNCMVNMEDMYEMENGETVAVKDMYNAYMNGKKNMQNAEKPIETKFEEVSESQGTTTINNSSEPKVPEPNENFEALNNAATAAAPKRENVPGTRSEKLARGQARYGSVAVGGK
jgi:hypothetical protein